MVTIFVGKTVKAFYVYKAYLCHYSPVFCTILIDMTYVNLPTYRPEIFGYFVHWLYHQVIYDESSGDTFPGYIVLMDLWFLAHNYGVIELKNAVLDVMVAHDNKVCNPNFCRLLKKGFLARNYL
jgi:hypothetical protein